ncbi:MAG TPA: non-homologous end-joining DNA ligase [Bryobacteraceae bacterium]|nr:non-homologous end-joining DNA ligase [Bryobacteraceae bacterium]
MTLDEITNPQKVFWPDEGYTKIDIAQFYAAVFPRLKPYVADRPLTMERCPDGMRGECFYQKAAPKGLPRDVPTQVIHHANRNVRYVVGGSLETQLALVNLGCIPVHVWASRADHQRQPDWVVFDLDPGSGKFADAARAGLLVKEALDALGFISFPKTSGSRGLHVFIPIRLGPDYDEVLPFAKQFSERLAAAHPKELTMEQRIESRKGRVYLDPFRNSFGATVAAPYSVRRREKAPFSIPLDWSEVKPSLQPSSFNLGNFEKRLSGADPWRDFFRARQSLNREALGTI